jgi:hypothetical protein
VKRQSKNIVVEAESRRIMWNNGVYLFLNGGTVALLDENTVTLLGGNDMDRTTG